MQTIYTSDIGQTPAAIDRLQGILYINPTTFDQLTPFQQKFIVEHEMGHYLLNTSDEIAADAYAFDKLAGTEFQSLKQSLGCILEVLKPHHPGYKQRIYELYKRALLWDYKNTNNHWALRELKRIERLNELDSFSFGLLTFDTDGVKQEADAFYRKMQAEVLKDRSSDSKKLLNWGISKSVMNTALAVALLCAVGYFIYLQYFNTNG